MKFRSLLPVTLIASLFLSGGAAALVAVTCPSEGIIGDYNNNGAIDYSDLAAHSYYYGQGSMRADLNRDCQINIADISVMYDLYYNGSGTLMDFNRDGTVDIGDWISFNDAYFVGSSFANVNGDCTVDIADFSVYSEWFTNGCGQ